MSEASPSLQQEISQLERELASKREVLEKEQPPKETLREVIGEKLATDQLAPPVPAADQAPSVSPPAPSVNLPADLQSQVQTLVNSAFTDSIDQAVKQARASHNPALIDAFHDALVDELYQYLVERGKLEKL